MSVYEESGMYFDPLFNSNRYQSFYVEKSELYERLKYHDVKSVEFIAMYNQSIYFIEAKGSFPNPNNPESIENIVRDCQMLYEKLQHSLDLLIAKKLGGHSTLSYDGAETLMNDLSCHKIIFLLVMGKNKKTGEWFAEEWCEAIKDELEKKLKPLISIWNIQVAVIDHEAARKLKMIV